MSIAAETAEATANPGKEDRFMFDIFESDMHFPCTVCIHKDQPMAECCTGCRYYFT